MTADEMRHLTAQVLQRFEQELAEVDELNLIHLEQRAEADYRTDLGEAMRALVDAEMARRRDSHWTATR